jgi:hypothetical protein
MADELEYKVVREDGSMQNSSHELQDGPTGYLIERVLDEARATRFRPARCLPDPFL